MCAQFILKTRANQLALQLGMKISELAEDLTWNLRVAGYMKIEQTPIILFEDGQARIQEACFSLCPTWSKTFPSPWSTYNARMERPKLKKNAKNTMKQQIDPFTDELEYIYQVPTWRESFTEGWTCLVPLTAAVESSYFGSHAGNVVRFSTKNEQIFFCTGLWSPWVDKATGELRYTFALITDDPYPYFYQCGHDRSVIVLDPKQYETWLSADMTPKQRFNFLRNHRIDQDWSVTIDRPMKKGWEKRSPNIDEIQAIKVWGGSV